MIKGKKGVSILLLVFEILLVVIITFTLVDKAREMGKSSTVVKTNLAEDVRMMIDTLIGVPGDAVIEYPVNVSEYVVLLGQEKLSVYQEGEEDKEGRKEKRGFFVPEGHETSGSFKEGERLCLVKQGRSIFLEECQKNG